MSELDKCYELLGVRPGVSVAELKAAYKDMAKVWHPDRFAHDPRLQQKAQEKLKEINEAYEQLVSGKTPRPRPASPRERATTDPRAVQKPGSMSRPLRWHWVAVPVLLFVVVFIYTTRSLLQSREQHPQATTEQTETLAAKPEAGASSSARVNPDDSTRNKTRTEPTPQGDDSPAQLVAVEPAQPEPQPVKTVTVTIDPKTGLLARADCPSKTRMTYPSGSEPQGYCTATHGPPAGAEANDSKLKSFAKRVASPGKWIDSNANKEKADNKPDQ